MAADEMERLQRPSVTESERTYEDGNPQQICVTEPEAVVSDEPQDSNIHEVLEMNARTPRDLETTIDWEGIKIEVIRAKDLKTRQVDDDDDDDGGPSSAASRSRFPTPYCFFNFKGNAMWTETVDHSVNPVWKQSFFVEVSELQDLLPKLQVHLVDFDSANQVDLENMGFVEIDFMNLPLNTPHKFWKQIRRGAGTVEFCVELRGSEHFLARVKEQQNRTQSTTREDGQSRKESTASSLLGECPSVIGAKSAASTVPTRKSTAAQRNAVVGDPAMILASSGARNSTESSGEQVQAYTGEDHRSTAAAVGKLKIDHSRIDSTGAPMSSSKRNITTDTDSGTIASMRRQSVR
eukprot:Lankesteria_metandrocarpae@DN5994_c0_g1_i1.p1